MWHFPKHDSTLAGPTTAASSQSISWPGCKFSLATHPFPLLWIEEISINFMLLLSGHWNLQIDIQALALCQSAHSNFPAFWESHHDAPYWRTPETRGDIGSTMIKRDGLPGVLLLQANLPNWGVLFWVRAPPTKYGRILVLSERTKSISCRNKAKIFKKCKSFCFKLK